MKTEIVAQLRASFERMKPFNSSRAGAAGLEVELASAPIRRLADAAFSASYTLLDTETLRGDAASLGKALPYRARHRLYARAGVAPGPVELHVEAHLVSLQYTDAANLAAIPAATVWNAGGSVALWRPAALRLHLEVRNLADDRTLLDGLGNPLPGRMVMLTLRAGSTDTGAP